MSAVLATITLEVRDDGTVGTRFQTDNRMAEPEIDLTLGRAIVALELERADFRRCPFHRMRQAQRETA